MSDRGRVSFDGVSKRWGDVTAVRDVSFTIEPGTLVTLLGPSGCGKTTTLRMIAGLELPSSGRIHIGGREVTHVSAADRDVGMVFQSYALFPHLDVLDNVRYGLVSQRVPRDRAGTLAKEALAQVGLSGLEARLPSELSGGQQQRVALARALVLSPEVLLFDEPLSNLDARLRRRMRQEIREIQQRLGFTAVYVTHDRDEALSISDRIVVMDRAAIVQQGTPRELYEAPASRFVAEFMAEANILEVELPSGEGAEAEVHLGPLVLSLPRRGVREGKAQLAVRPEAVHLEPAGSAEQLQGTIASRAYLGAYVEYEIELPSGRLRVLSGGSEPELQRGQAVGIRLDPRGAALLPQ